jgi:DNA end-binding protein Ku
MTMAARAMWKADLTVDAVRIPVKLYAAVQDTAIHFRLLHATDLAPVKQAMVDPATDQPVPKERIRKGVTVDRNLIVMVSDEELKALEPRPSRDISVEQVLEATAIDERWYDRPYYLGPDGDEEAYFALAEALESKGRIGVARWVLRKKQYVGALQGRDGHLMLDTLRHVEEIVRVDAVRPPAERAPDPRELKLAEQLIATLEGGFDAKDYRDEHREQVMKLIEAKASGKVVRFPKQKPRKSDASLLDNLRASLKQRGEASRGR